MQVKQIVVVVAVVAVMAYLYNLPVKGLSKPKEAAGHTNAVAVAAKPRPVVSVSIEMVSASSKLMIGQALAAQVNELENRLKNATGAAAQLAAQKALAKKWDDVNQAAPAAFYYKDIAAAENTFADWLAAGNRFNDAFKFTQDTVAQPSYVVSAIDCFTNAAKIQPNNLDAKTGLGVAYVNQFSLGIDQGEGGPPKGVMMLLDVVAQDPKNRNANLSLGMFAMKSGQYEKAVQRFKTVIEQKPEVEPYFYLAESYKQLGMKKEAIEAYQKCKEMMPDPAFDQRINDYIKELKN